MRAGIIAFGITIVAFSFGSTVVHAEEVRCQAIRDSAQCAAQPECWYDAANNKGCLPGPPPAVDRCGNHSSESVCSTSSFGCTWNAGDEKCESKAP
jgi:hypothetical protein